MALNGAFCALVPFFQFRGPNRASEGAGTLLPIRGYPSGQEELLVTHLFGVEFALFLDEGYHLFAV